MASVVEIPTYESPMRTSVTACSASSLDPTGSRPREVGTGRPSVLRVVACNQPGYFTTIAGFEAPPVGNLFFAGEHTSSFYEQQGSWRAPRCPDCARPARCIGETKAIVLASPAADDIEVGMAQRVVP
jgi:hypothetical protein